MKNIAPVAAEVRQDVESEEALVAIARDALSKCNWKIGECASLWTERWSKGRTDEDFGALVGLSGDQIQQRRTVWERWAGVSDTYRNLSWSHFYAAVNWDDAEDCLKWASGMQATVSEMKAWRKAQSGDELEESVPPLPGSRTAARDRAGYSDPFDSDDPFATPGEELPPPPESGEESAEEEKQPRDPAELFRLQKSKAVKTGEAFGRAIADLNDLKRKRNTCQELVDSITHAIETLKGW